MKLKMDKKKNSKINLNLNQSETEESKYLIVEILHVEVPIVQQEANEANQVMETLETRTEIKENKSWRLNIYLCLFLVD